ncbi:MAG: Stp1/IreP family PP2C-type Ser/Thr phosphatase [Lachnospiraceae bacterium]|nr:Stp1/IreP family PP2C-type Ser/Thr phosphatase [Lachnospiraceae bacterium]
MLKTFSITDIGKKRLLNQDIVFTSEKAIGNLPNVFIVADGMGGHKAGDYASRYTVEIVTKEIEQSEEQNPIRIIRQAVEKANQRIREAAEADERLEGMGTTIVVATCDKDILRVANVGDSRLYIVNREIQQITRDHSLVEEMVRMGGIDRESARIHPDKNIITRAVGAQDSVDVDFFQVKLQPQDTILMCSDGLTNMLEDEEICTIINAQGDVASKAEELVKAANNNGGKDNIAVIIIEPLIDEVEL